MSSERIEQWNQRYRAGEQVFRAPSPLVIQFAGGMIPGAALDLACGPGRNTLYLAQRGWRVVALDGSAVAIELLLARARQIEEDRKPTRKLSIDARVVDLEAAPEAGDFEIQSEAFDLVLSCYYFQRDLIPRVKSALRPGGLLIMIAHLADADQPQGTPTRSFPGELRAFFKDWRILHYREGDSGESCHRRAVAEVVAEKPQEHE